MAGKGCKTRPFNRKKYGNNYEDAFGHSKACKDSGKFVVRNGVLVAVGGIAGLRQADSKNIRSVSMGINPSQIPKFKKEFAGMGVKFDSTNGNLIFKDRKSKLAVMKKRGMYDKDEVCG